MSDLKQLLTTLGGRADDHFDRLKFALERRFAADTPLLIQPYRWHGTVDTLFLRGRVLRDNGLRPATSADTLWDNLLNTYRRFESDEVPGARLRAGYGGAAVELVTDEEGYFAGALPITAAHAAVSPWREVDLTLLAPATASPVVARAPVLVPPSGSTFGVISDVDDTVLQSHAANLLRVARVTFLQNARLRLPFAGVAAFYRALRSGGDGRRHNPIFYLSSSPWNLYDLLSDFLALQRIPAGPLLLRDIGFDADKLLSTSHHDHKVRQIEHLFDIHPRLDFILIGDSGQKDPEIYAEIVARYPERVLGIYIRDVTDDDRDAAVRRLAATLPVAMHLVPDSLSAARDAADRGWIDARALAGIASETALDAGEPGAVERLLDGGDNG